jgi:hypothetical protein
MKAIVLAALFANVEAIRKTVAVEFPDQQEVVLQIGVQEAAEENIRTEVAEDLRNYLAPPHESFLQRGEAWPETVLPGGEAILPLNFDAVHPYNDKKFETGYAEPANPLADTIPAFVQLEDDMPTVAEARVQAA